MRPALMREHLLAVRRITRNRRIAEGPSSSENWSASLKAAYGVVSNLFVSLLERGLENPTVAVLERIAKALSANIEELFKVARAGEPAPRPLRGGRRPKR